MQIIIIFDLLRKTIVTRYFLFHRLMSTCKEFHFRFFQKAEFQLRTRGSQNRLSGLESVAEIQVSKTI